MSSLRACFRTLVACAVLWCCVSPAIAGVRRHDRDDTLHTSLANHSPYAAVGQVTLVNDDGVTVGLGSGTHIGDGWILTAAHVVDNLAPGDFIVGPYGAGSGQSISAGDIYQADASEVHVHTGWNSDNLLGGNDVAVFRLSGDYSSLAVAELAPVGVNPVGRPATAVGYGRTGVGSKGHNPQPPDPSVPNAPGTKRAGTNMIDLRGGQVGPEQNGGVYLNASSVATSILLSDFDNPGNTNASLLGEQTPLYLEYSIAPGDSGGALMIVDPSDPQNQLLAGIHSFVASVQAETDDERIIGDVNEFVDSSYGELQGYTEVSPFIADFIYPNTGIPEPATMVLLVSMGGLLLRRRASR
ncbi:MAG: trypsin-like serine protease [Phycisphaerae bacterium]